MVRVYNFSPGPGMVSEDVLKKAQKDFLCYGDSGMSVMEMSHRSSDFKPIIGRAESLVHQLLGLGEQYKVLFLHRSTTLQK